MASETTPLVSKNGTSSSEPPSNSIGSGPTAYFLDGVHRRRPSTMSAGEESFHTAPGEDVNNMPKGGVAAEFNPRPVSGPVTGKARGGKGHKMKQPSVGGGWLDYAVTDSWRPKVTTPAPGPASGGGKGGDSANNAGEIGSLVRLRKVPIKVEPKVHFGNERTFLAWLHVVVILAAGSVTILTYSTDDNLLNQLYGIVLLPVSIAYIFYALSQYVRRAKMIQNHEPGPYIDVAGPTTLTVILMATIIAQFCAQLHSMYG